MDSISTGICVSNFARTVFAWFAGLIMFAVALKVNADMGYLGLFDLAEKSDVTLVGKVTTVGPDTATLEVTEVLAGEWKAKTATLSPITMATCTGAIVNFKVGEEALVLGRKAEGDRLNLDVSGGGKRTMIEENRSDTMALVRTILGMLKLPATEQKFAMLEAARSKNFGLRVEASCFISTRISSAEDQQKYAPQLIALLNDSVPEVQRIGLQALRFAKVPEAQARIIELTLSTDINVVSDASICLSPINTPESIAARIALASHANPDIRVRACIDLDNCRTLEAKAVLTKLLYDKDAKVRAMAPRGFVYWLRDDNADDVIPRLLEMLADENAEVRSSTADKLGECIRPELIAPLIATVKRPGQDDATMRAAFQALSCQYSKGKSASRELVEAELQIVIDAVKNGKANDSYGPAFQCLGILDLCTKPEAKEALLWASKFHPNAEIRDYAERSLSRPR